MTYQPDGSRPFKTRTELSNNTVYVKAVTSQVRFRHKQIFFGEENSYEKKNVGKITLMKNEIFNCIFCYHYDVHKKLGHEQREIESN